MNFSSKTVIEMILFAIFCMENMYIHLFIVPNISRQFSKEFLKEAGKHENPKYIWKINPEIFMFGKTEIKCREIILCFFFYCCVYNIHRVNNNVKVLCVAQ